MENYLDINRTHWNAKVPVHLGSPFYDVPAFLVGKSSLNPIELELLGDVRGKRILHLQCHFGLDTLSLARKGAQVTGVDFSDAAITSARELAGQAGLDATFICSDVYALPEVLHETFDVVFTSYGVLGWLPDMERWAQVVARYLKPGGSLVLAEFHPVVWMMDYDFTHVSYAYFNAGVIVEEEEGTYADREAGIKTTSHGWNHALAEVLGALLKQGLQLRSFNEYDYSPYSCFHHMVEVAPGHYQVKGLEGKLPLVYSLCAVR